LAVSVDFAGGEALAALGPIRYRPKAALGVWWKTDWKVTSFDTFFELDRESTKFRKDGLGLTFDSAVGLQLQAAQKWFQQFGHVGC